MQYIAVNYARSCVQKISAKLSRKITTDFELLLERLAECLAKMYFRKQHTFICKSVCLSLCLSNPYLSRINTYINMYSLSLAAAASKVFSTDSQTVWLCSTKLMKINENEKVIFSGVQYSYLRSFSKLINSCNFLYISRLYVYEYLVVVCMTISRLTAQPPTTHSLTDQRRNLTNFHRLFASALSIFKYAHAFFSFQRLHKFSFRLHLLLLGFIL